MKSNIRFNLPDVPGSRDENGHSVNRSRKGDEMVYKFSGDDDVWVFVDGKIALDLGGIHGKVYGEINFSTGKIKIVNEPSISYENGVITASSSGDNTIILDFANTALKDLGAGEHTLSLYYLERGSSQSNCAIYFNLAPKFTTKAVRVTKEWWYRRANGETIKQSKNAGDEMTFQLYRTTTAPNAETSQQSEATVPVKRNGHEANMLQASAISVLTSNGKVHHGEKVYFTVSGHDANGKAYTLNDIAFDWGDSQAPWWHSFGTEEGIVVHADSSTVGWFIVPERATTIDLGGWGKSGIGVTLWENNPSNGVYSALAANSFESFEKYGDEFRLGADETYNNIKVPRYDYSGNEYYYYVVEKNAASSTEYMYTAEPLSTDAEGANRDIWLVKNYREQTEKTSVRIQKVWLDEKEHNESVSIKLIRYIKNASDQFVPDASFAGQTVTLSSENSWSQTVSNLDIYNNDGQIYYYAIEEESVPVGYEVSYSEQPLAARGATITFTATNTPIETGSVQVTKTFTGIKADQIPSDFQITASWGEDNTRVLKISGMADYPDVSVSGSSLSYTWTISGIEIGTEVTFTESGYEVNGYDVSASATASTATTPDSVSSTNVENENDVPASDPTATAITPGNVSFTNDYTPIPPGTLVLVKNVTEGSDPTGETFTFIVTFMDSDETVYTGFVQVTDSGRTNASVLADSEGKVYVTVAEAGTATISNIPAGTKYTVEEEAASNNWRFVSQSMSEGADGTIDSEEEETVTMLNEQLISVYAKKEWKLGEQPLQVWPEDTTLTFELQYNAANVQAENEQPTAQDDTADAQAENPQPETMDDSVDVQAENWQPVRQDANGNLITDITVDKLGNIVFDNLPRGLQYRVVETAINGRPLDPVIVATGSGNGTTNNPLVITNVIPTVNISATKVWGADDKLQPVGVQFKLLRRTAENGQGAAELATGDNDQGAAELATGDNDQQAVEVATAVVTETQLWTVKWNDLPKYVNPYAAEEERIEYIYSVEETGIYFARDEQGQIDENSLLTDEVILSKLYEIKGGTITYDTVNPTEGSTQIINTPKNTIDIPLEKAWDDFASSNYWECVFVLEQIEVHESGPVFEDYIQVWTPVKDEQNQAEIQKTIYKDSSAEDKVFKNQELYHIYPNGGVYRVKYAVKEIGYTVWKDSSKATVLHQWSQAGLTAGEQYLPTYVHDAGDLDELVTTEDDLRYYSIVVTNDKDSRQQNKKVDVSIRKEWEGTIPPGAYARFKLQRTKTESYREYDANYDLTTIYTVTLAGKNYPFAKGTKIYVEALLASDANGQIQFNLPENKQDQIGKYQSTAGTTIGRTTNPIVVNQNFEITISSNSFIGDKLLDLYLTDLHPGSSMNKPDDSWNSTNPNAQEFTLDAENRTKEFRNLVLREEQSISDGNRSQTVFSYSYYFVETESYPAGYYASFTKDNASGIKLGDAAHLITDDAHIYALNKPIPPFAVEKKWYSLEDPANYPEVRFTLYQGRIVNGVLQQGTVFVDSKGTTYNNIPLGKNNNWHWDCPVYLPDTDASGQPVGYYVQENTSGNNSGHVLLYQNSTFISNEEITYGAPLAPGQGEKYDVKPLDYYNDQNSNHARTNDQEFPKGEKGGIAGNTGTITILNRAPKYMQMDIKKKILMVQSDGSVATVMDNADVQKDIVLEIRLLRRVIDESSGSDVFLTDWEQYGVPFMIGFDSSGNAIQQNSNSFVLVKQSGFFWRIVLDTYEANQYGFGQNTGLPAYGYYTKMDGTVIPVRYRYIPEEIGAYRNFAREPMLNGFEWFVGFQPSAWDGNGSQVDTFPPLKPNHDQDRIKNVQASNLFVEKDWEDIPTNVQEVYIKLYRAYGSETKEDVTKEIYQRTTAYSGYGMIDFSRMTNLNISSIGPVLVFRPGDSPIEVHKLPVISDKSNNYNTDPYYYWIEEVGYKDKNGVVHTDSSKFATEYDKYVNGAWQNSWSTNAAGNKMSLGQLNGNRIRANNYPTMDFKVKKEWRDKDGNLLEEPWNADPAISQIEISVTRIAQKYVNGHATGEPVEEVLTFAGSQRLTIEATGKKLQLAVAQGGGTAYSISSNENTDQPWTTEFVGLQQIHKDRSTGDIWHYTYEINEKTVLNDCITTMDQDTVTADGQTVRITNQKADAKLTVVKLFVGFDDQDLTVEQLEQKNGLTFTVTSNDPTNHPLKDQNGNTVEELTKTYADFVDNAWVLDSDDGIVKNVTYTVTESLTDIDGMTLTEVKVSVGGHEEEDYNESVQVPVDPDTSRGSVIIRNIYSKGISVNVTKIWTQADQPKTTADSISFTLHQVLTAEGMDPIDEVYTAYGTNRDGVGTVTYDATSGWATETIPNLPQTVKRIVNTGETTSEVTYNASYYVAENNVTPDAGYVLATTYSNEAGAVNPVPEASAKTVNSDDATITIINTETPGVELPATGGRGTLVFTVSGLALMMLAGVLMISRRRRNDR